MFKRIKHEWHSLGLFRRLTIFFLVFSIIPIIILGIVSVNIALTEVKKRYVNDTSFRLEQVDKQMEELFTYLDYINITFSIDEDVKNVITQPMDNESVIISKNALDKKLYESKYASDIETSIYLIGVNGRVYSNDYGNSIEINSMTALDNMVQINSGRTVIMWDEMAACDYRRVITARRIEQRSTREMIGVVVTAVNIRHITDIFDIYFSDAQNNIMMVYEGRVIASSGDDLPQGAGVGQILGGPQFGGGDAQDMVTVQSQSYVTMVSTIENSDVLLASLIPQAEISGAMMNIVSFMIVLCLGIAVCFILAAVAMSRSISRPINKLCVSMQNAEDGQYIPGFTPRYNDEVGMLARNFNNMMMKTNDYIKRIGVVEREKHIAEYKALVSQINPHFLYNTLTSIIWLINNDKKDDAMEMTNALSQLFRISINKDEYISIEREMDYCQCYLAIQKLRYTNELTYSIKIAEEVKRCKIIKLVVQPIIENALYHGVRNKDGGGHIAIEAKLHGGCLHITVIDDGGALTKQKCEEINTMLAGGKSMPDAGIGIKNADDRLKLYYGKRYGIFFNVKDGRTIVAIIIPARTEENDV